MTDVKSSRLYKTLKKAVRKEDHAELLRMLEMVPAYAYNDKHSRWDGFSGVSLLEAFSWFGTPQGWDYWNSLSDKLLRAGHDCY